MTTFVSKPAEIEAIQNVDGEVSDHELLAFGRGSVTIIDGVVFVDTLNGRVELLPDHWLIRGENDYYPCDPDTFAVRWEEKK